MESTEWCLFKRLNGKSQLRIVLWTVVVIAFAMIVVWVFRINRNRSIRPESIILISLDTTRADHLSCYGYKYKTTPNIDMFAKDAVLFENFFANIPLTMPSHTSMFTGVIPPIHTVHDNYHIFSDSLSTLPEILKGNGYSTYGIVSALVLDKRYGLNRGFDVYYDTFTGENTKGTHETERTGDETAAHAMKWLEENHDKKKFMFIHFYDPHDTYRPPVPFDKRFKNPYDGEIAFADYCIGRFLDKLKSLDLYNDSLIIITGDHGELLGEHGEPAHGFYIYQNVLRVPLIVKPAGRGKSFKVTDNTTLIDIAPTILSQIGIEIPSDMQGLDLSDYFIRQDHHITNRFIYNESLYPTKYNGNSLLGVINDQWHYIQTTRPELYNRIVDPGERNNLIEKEPKRADFLKKHLRQILDDAASIGAESGMTLNSEPMQVLESLGYVGGAVDTDLTFNQTKTDPKNLIKIHTDIRKSIGFARGDRHDESIKLCRQIIQKYPDIAPTYGVLAENYEKLELHDKAIEVLQKQLALLAKDISGDQPQAIDRLNMILKPVENTHFRLGNIFRKQGKFDEAMSHYRQCLQINPFQAEAHNNLGNSLVRLGNLDEAIGHYRKALQITPDYTEAHNNLGVALVSLGKLEQAEEHYQKALLINPDDAITHNNLAALFRQLGRVDEAIVHCRRSLQIDSTNVNVHDNLALLLNQQGKIDEAIHQYSKALNLNPDDTSAHYNLAVALVSQGKLEKAIYHFQQSLKLNPDNANAHYNLAVALVSQSKLEKASDHFQQSLSLNPDDAETHYNLGKVLRKMGKVEKAMEYYQMALRINPDYIDAHYRCAVLLFNQNKTAKAVVHWKETIRLRPDWSRPQNDLAWVLATDKDENLRNPAEAVRLAKRACELTQYSRPEFLDTLAAANAAAGDFPKAKEIGEKALQLVVDNEDLANEIQKRLELYKVNKPYIVE